MDNPFDLTALLKKHERTHKEKPARFKSVAGGVLQRLENNIKTRKSSRLSSFDSARSLPTHEVSHPKSEAQLKQERRRKQLDKWKEEKEQKKKIEATKKKKPFVAGIPHAPLKYVPPPPPKPMPSTSGRVTRSQNLKKKYMPQNNSKKRNQIENALSFAPNNASFKPVLKSLTELPTLENVRNTRKKMNTITFAPVSPKVIHTEPMVNSPTSKQKMSKYCKINNKQTTHGKSNTENIPPIAKKSKNSIQSITSNSDSDSLPTKMNKSGKNKILTSKQIKLRENSTSNPDGVDNVNNITKEIKIKTTASYKTVQANDSNAKKEVGSKRIRTTRKSTQGDNNSSTEEDIKVRKLRSTQTSMKAENDNSAEEEIEPRKTRSMRKSFIGENGSTEELIESRKTRSTRNFVKAENDSSSEQEINSTKKRTTRKSVIAKKDNRTEEDVGSIKTRRIRKSNHEEKNNINSTTKEKRSRKSRTRIKSIEVEITNSATEEAKSRKHRTPNKAINAEDMNCTPTNLVPKSESSSEERLRSPKSLMAFSEITDDIAISSPCVTLSRGKDKARNEMKQKIKEGLLDEDVSDINAVCHFRRQMDSEIKRMTELCDTWEKISQQTPLSEAAQEGILSAVGLARLLMSQKMQQFAGLVSRCERPETGVPLVTPADLQGFWDMVFLQVENVYIRFKKLEELRARNWVEEVPVVQKKKAPKLVKNNSSKPAANSRLRDLIAAARKAKKEVNPPVEDSGALGSGDNCKTFEAGFFRVQSPVKSPTAFNTPSSRPSLLMSVVQNEAQKVSASKNSASFAMLRASNIGKSVERNESFTLEEKSTVPLTPINLKATPGPSILKSASETSTKKKSRKKSLKMMLVNEFGDEELFQY